MLDGKKVILQKLCFFTLALMGQNVLELQAESEVDDFGTRWQRYDGDLPFIILQMRENFQNHLLHCSGSKPRSC